MGYTTIMTAPKHHYPRTFPNIERIRLGAKALIVNAGKILVIRENIKYNGESFIIHDFPGGGIEPGEELIVGLKREVFEEVGLRVKVGSLLGTWDFVVPKTTDPNTAIHVVCLGYQCECSGGIKIDTSKNPAEEDIFEAIWLTKDEILAAGEELLPVPEMLEAVKLVKI